MIDPETEHLMIRAKEEALLAIQAKHPAAARAHQGMAVRYSTKAVIGLVAESEDPVERRPLVPAGADGIEQGGDAVAKERPMWRDVTPRRR